MSGDEASQQLDRIDPIDHKLIDALRRNARTTNRALAEFLELSPSASLARLRKLEKSRIILGYTVVIDDAIRRGAQDCFVEVELGSHDPSHVSRFETLVRTDHEVVAAFRVSGRGDYFVHVSSPAQFAWARLSQALARLGVPVAQVRLSTVVQTLKKSDIG